METGENLESILREVEQYVSAAGWDQPTRLFALVSTTELMASDPDLANELDLSAEQPLTSIEQEVSHEQDLEDLLGTIAWPDEVLGAVLSIERIVLPPDAESSLPTDDEFELAEVAASHPDRKDVRMVCAVLRDGTNLNALRYRDHDEPDAVAIAPNLIERLNESLLATFES